MKKTKKKPCRRCGKPSHKRFLLAGWHGALFRIKRPKWEGKTEGIVYAEGRAPHGWEGMTISAGAFDAMISAPGSIFIYKVPCPKTP